MHTKQQRQNRAGTHAVISLVADASAGNARAEYFREFSINAALYFPAANKAVLANDLDLVARGTDDGARCLVGDTAGHLGGLARVRCQRRFMHKK